MIIAILKRKENIAEYLLYMFQVEDLIRALSFDINLIDEQIISNFEQPYPVKREIREWYASLIYIMKNNKIIIKGHLPEIQRLINNLENFHKKLIRNKNEAIYHEAYSKAKLGIEALLKRSGTATESEIEACLNGLYGLLMLRLTKKSISAETTDAFKTISEMMAALSAKYLDFENKLSHN